MWIDRMLRSRIRHDDKTDQIQQKFMVFLYSELNIDLITFNRISSVDERLVKSEIVLQLVDPLSQIKG